MKRFGFHFRLLVTAFVLIGGAVFVMGYQGLHMTLSYVQDRFEERNKFLAGYLARNAELGILIGDERILGRLASNLMSESDVLGVEIFDSRDNVIVAMFEEEVRDYIVSRSQVVSRSLGDESLPGMDFQGPDHLMEVIGEVAIYFSLEEIQGIQTSMGRTFVLLSFGVALLSILVFYIISRSLVNPVNRLARIAGRIASGNRKVRAVPDNIPETRELALAFNSMLDSLDKSSKELERLYNDMARQKTMAELGKFAMLIAHEVKNPLGIIKSSLDILKDEAGLANDHPMVHYIEDEIRRISRLLEDFLAFSRPSRPVLTEVELNALVRDCVHRFELQVENGNLRLIQDVDPDEFLFQADPDLLAKGIHNLLKNALEANEFTGDIFVKTYTQPGKWFMEVEDQGPGIALGMEEKIFEPFFTTRTRGSGLGLAFVSYVVDAHGGKVSGYNKDEGGAVFKIELRG